FMQDTAMLDKTMQALWFATHLWQPFGALLFQPLLHVEYKQITMDSLITFQICNKFQLTDLIDNIYNQRLV
ncbi:hypothetical protein J3R82DRAFT_10954, partial [Butyriboletus roseoflavus]